jgi:hypothetical protein
MTVPWTVTFDCHDAAGQAHFWKVALGYVDAPPPTGWDTWESWLRHFNVPEDEWGDGAAICDPDGVLPRVGFLKVPEGKSVKNRVHLDVHASGGRHLPHAQRWPQIQAKSAELQALGATVLSSGPAGDDEGLPDHFVMADPEGNEFCVV